MPLRLPHMNRAEREEMRMVRTFDSYWWVSCAGREGFDSLKLWDIYIYICNIVTVRFGIKLRMLRRMKLENVNSADVRNSLDMYDRLISNECPHVHV